MSTVFGSHGPHVRSAVVASRRNVTSLKFAADHSFVSATVREQEQWDDDFLFQGSESSSPPPPPRNRRDSPVPSFSDTGWTESEAEDPMSIEDDDDVSSGGEGTETEAAGPGLGLLPGGSKKSRAAAGRRVDDDMAMEGVISSGSSPGVGLGALSLNRPTLPAASSSGSLWATDALQPRPLLNGNTSYGSSSSSNHSFHPPATRSVYSPPPAAAATLLSPTPRSPMEHFPVSPVLSDTSISHSLSHLGGSGPVRRAADAFGSEASRASRPRARLRKRSRVGEARLRDDSAEARHEADAELSDEEPSTSVDAVASPRQLISRGMNSIQKRLSISNKSRVSRPSSPELERSALTSRDGANKLRKESPADLKRSRRISIPGLSIGSHSSSSYPVISTSPDSSMHASPATSFSSGPAPAVSTRRPVSIVKGFHLPTRSNSVKVKADQSSTGLGMPSTKSSVPPPPKFAPPSPRKSRPTSVQIPPRSSSYGSSFQLGGQGPSSRSTPQDQVVQPSFKPVAPPAPAHAEPPMARPTVTQRLSSFGKKSAHRVTASVSSIPTNPSPTVKNNVPLPPTGPNASNRPAQLERSNSNPSVHGLTRRNSLRCALDRSDLASFVH